MNSIEKTYDRKFKLKISQDILEKKVTTKKIAEEYNISRQQFPDGFQNIVDTGKMLLLDKEKDYLIKQISTFLNRKIND